MRVGGEDCSTITFSFSAARKTTFYLTSVFFVYFAVTSFGLLTFGIPSEKADVRLSVISSLLMALISARLTVFTFTPRVHHVTVLDVYATWNILLLAGMGVQAILAPYQRSSLLDLAGDFYERNYMWSLVILAVFWLFFNVGGLLLTSTSLHHRKSLLNSITYNLCVGCSRAWWKRALRCRAAGEDPEPPPFYCCEKARAAAALKPLKPEGRASAAVGPSPAALGGSLC
jgi:hypothetical protein